MSSRVLVDTGPIVAMLSVSDEHHEACVEQLQLIQGSLLTCWPVITEAAWLLRSYTRVMARLLTSFNGSPFELAALGEEDLLEIEAILGKYEGLGLQLADAALVHIANRDGIDTIFTLDRRDFSVVPLSRGRRFRLIP